MAESQFRRAEDLDFKRGAIRPMECFHAGWQLIKAEYWLFLGITFVAVMLGSLAPMAILMGPAMCGIYLCLLRRQRGEEVTFNLLFDGFQYFVPSLIATLIMVVPVMVVAAGGYVVVIISMFLSMPMQGQHGRQPDPSVPWLFLGVLAAYVVVLSVLSFIMGVLCFFVYPLIVDRKLTGWQAVRLSLRAVKANLGGVIGLILLNAVLGFVGVLLCYVGAIFVLPLHYAAVAVAYRQVFPPEELEEDSQQVFAAPRGF